jgi:hypothetical protein
MEEPVLPRSETTIISRDVDVQRNTAATSPTKSSLPDLTLENLEQSANTSGVVSSATEIGASNSTTLQPPHSEQPLHNDLPPHTEQPKQPPQCEQPTHSQQPPNIEQPTPCEQPPNSEQPPHSQQPLRSEQPALGQQDSADYKFETLNSQTEKGLETSETERGEEHNACGNIQHIPPPESQQGISTAHPGHHDSPEQEAKDVNLLVPCMFLPCLLQPLLV